MDTWGIILFRHGLARALLDIIMARARVCMSCKIFPRSYREKLETERFLCVH